jgi:hypothetical protein
MTYKAKVAVCSEVPKNTQRKTSTMWKFLNFKPRGMYRNR